LYSPDGRHIAYRAQRAAGFEADRWELMLYDLQTQQSASLTANLDLSIESLLWSPDSRRIYFEAAEKGDALIYRCEIATRGVEQILGGHFSHSDLAVSRDNQKLFFTRQTL